MKLKFWGVRGSIPTPGPDTVEYGGNTSCVSLDAGGERFIFDCGTGLRKCGESLLASGAPVRAAILISHTHWDHIQGFPFFAPAYLKGNAFMIYGPPNDVRHRSLRQIMEMQTSHEYFPVSAKQLGASIVYVDCRGEEVKVGEVSIRTCRLNHPVACLAYKVSVGGKTVVYGGDHEPYRNPYRDCGEAERMDAGVLAELDRDAEAKNAEILEFCRGADLAVWDSQYTEKEYPAKRGWGHSWHEYNLRFAREAGIRHMVFNHHDPNRGDAEMRGLERFFRAEAERAGFRLDFAREGMEIEI